MKRQRFFGLATLIFLLPSLGRGQSIETTLPIVQFDQSCTTADREAVSLLESRLKQYDAVVLGVPTLGTIKVICGETDGGGYGGGIGALVWVGHAGEHKTAFAYRYIHERAHWFLGLPCKWSFMEALAELATQMYIKLLGLWNPDPWIEWAVRSTSTYNLALSYHGGWPMDYYRAFVTLLLISSANEGGDWAYSGVVRRVYEELRRNRRLDDTAGATAPDRLETIQRIARGFPYSPDSQQLELWLRQQPEHRNPTFGKSVELVSFRQKPPGGLIPDIRNPRWFEVLSFFYPEPQTVDINLLRRPQINRIHEDPGVNLVTVLDWQGRVVWTMPVLLGMYELPADLRQGAYTLKIQTIEGRVLSLNHFVRLSDEYADKGVLVLKTASNQNVSDFPIQVRDAEVLLERPGFAIVEPECSTRGPCRITISSAGEAESFAILPSYADQQTIRLGHRLPVFNLHKVVEIRPGGWTLLPIRNLSGVTKYEWSLKAVRQLEGVRLGQSSGQGDATVTVTSEHSAAVGQEAILRFDCPESVDTPQYILLRVVASPPRARR